MGVERKIYSPPYRPQSNGRIEGFHKFLKSCLAKHISRHREWDDVVPLATASYNWLPNQHSKESPFFVMFGRDASNKSLATHQTQTQVHGYRRSNTRSRINV